MDVPTAPPPTTNALTCDFIRLAPNISSNFFIVKEKSTISLVDTTIKKSDFLEANLFKMIK